MRGRPRIAFVSEGILGASYQVFHSSYQKFFPQRDLYLSRELTRWVDVDRVVIDPREGLSPEARQALSEVDAVVFHNPEIGPALENIQGVSIIFDCIDWYEEILEEEFGSDPIRCDRMAEAMRASCEIAHAVTCQSPVLLHWLTERFLLCHKILSVVPNGYDDALFKPAGEGERRRIRAELTLAWPALARFRFWIIYQGKLGRWYRNLRSCLQEVEALENTALICVGDGPLREPFESMALTSTVFVGAVAAEEVPRFTRSCDAAVFPVNDCSPIVVGEYLGCGLPVVARGPRLSWLIGHNENGCLIKGEVGDWACGIRYALEKWGSKEERRAISVRARGLTWKAQAMRFLAVIESCLRAGLSTEPTPDAVWR